MKCTLLNGIFTNFLKNLQSKNVIEAEWDPEGYSGPIEFKSVVVYEFELGQKLAIDLEI